MRQGIMGGERRGSMDVLDDMRAYMRENDLTQAEIGALLRRSQPSISRYLSGTRALCPDTADALRYRLSRLTGRRK
jgi:predicted transcriptional regulator